MSTEKRQKSSKGNAILESSLILGAFLAMMIGAFDFGQFLFVHQALVERARYAARWGAVTNPSDTTSIQNMVLYYQSTAPSSGTSGYFGLTSGMVSVTTQGGIDSTHPNGTDDYRLIITISNYPYSILSPYIAGTYMGPNINIVVPLGLPT